MAPKKKKQKAAANVNRGFATTSVISKPREDEKSKISADNAKESEQLPQKNQDTPAAAKIVSKDAVADQPLANLTPEQLEAELENSELQLLVDTHALKSKKEASRHDSRLRTERRLLRSSAEPLNTARWLPMDATDKILEWLAVEQESNREYLRADRMVMLERINVDDLTVKLWTLKKALGLLGFTGEKIETTIKNLLDGHIEIMDGSLAATKDSLWGLEECISYLATICDRDELPQYENHQTTVLEREKLQSRQKLQQAQAVSLRRSSTKEVNDPITDSNISTVTTSTPEATTCHGREESEAQDSDISSTDSETDLETSVDRYLSLQTKLFARNPDLTYIKSNSSKKSKAGPAVKTGLVETRSKKLLDRIQKIESDILFDKDEAHHKWLEVRNVLLSEAAERRKFFSRPEGSAKPGNLERQQKLQEVVGLESDAEDESLTLNDLFAALPDKSTSQNNDGRMLTTLDRASMVRIREFGKVSGPSPKKVFEDTCKTRDPGFEAHFSIISTTPHSVRHMVRVEWSKPQDIPEAVNLEGITSLLDSTVMVVEMSSVSCPDIIQSEAFISTVALFLLFSNPLKEEKSYLRLPSVWRELWAEFVETKKAQIDMTDKTDLRSVKSLVEKLYGEIPSPAFTESRKFEPRTSTGQKEKQRVVPDTLPIKSDERLKDYWWSKTSSIRYQRMLKFRSTLPIWSFRSSIVEAVDANQAIILCGETGCGKSTQLPSFLLEHALSNGRPCKIYCTEPRRISAISLARRVSEELGEHKNDVGTSKSLVGYAIRLESKTSPSTRLVYATTGIVMRMLESTDGLSDITHLVLDEIHERTIDSDFLLIILRKLLKQRPDLKAVLMSATVNADRFSAYLGGAPILNVPGRTFPVETKFLEDAIELTGYGTNEVSNTRASHFGIDENNEEEERIQHSIAKNDLDGYSAKTKQVLAEYNEYQMNYDLLLRLLETVATDHKLSEFSKAILVFMPGIAEIRRLSDQLVGHSTFASGWEIFPLHSTISMEDQERAFSVPLTGIRKIVIATNIAETGITIPDITCVIDTGKHREMRFDERRQLSRLIEAFISRANAKQRRGRAGRVQNGLCFHLFTKARHDRYMTESQTPEMLRLSLQDLALRVKICKLGGIETTLTEALDPPSPKNIRRAVDSLIVAKALTSSEELTALGRQLAKLPLDVYLGKLIIHSRVFNCLDAGLTIAAIMSCKSPFQAPLGARSQADSVRLAFKRGDSDLLTIYNAYCAWKKVCNTSGASERQFCKKNFLSSMTLSNIEDLKAQLTAVLLEVGFITLNENEKSSLNRARFYSRQRHFVDIPLAVTSDSGNDVIVTSVIASSFYPKLLVREGKGYRNVSNNQRVGLSPSSVNKASDRPPIILSFYEIMQSSNKYYNAQETSAAHDFAVALLCGDAEFRMYSGVLLIDGNRLKFSIPDWKLMVALKALRSHIRNIITQSYKSPGHDLTDLQAWWFNMLRQLFSQPMEQKN